MVNNKTMELNNFRESLMMPILPKSETEVSAFFEECPQELS